MARPRAPIFQVEPLEGKQLLSTMHVAHPAAPKHAALILDGDLKDPSGQVVTNSDQSQSKEQFAGRVKGMGAVIGTLNYYDNNLMPPSEEANIVLANASGSVTLDFLTYNVLSSADTGTKSITRIHFNVVSGSGVYAGASGAGVLTLTQPEFASDPPSVDLKLHTTLSH